MQKSLNLRHMGPSAQLWKSRIEMAPKRALARMARVAELAGTTWKGWLLLGEKNV